MGCGGSKQDAVPAKKAPGGGGGAPSKPGKSEAPKTVEKEVDVMGKYRMLMGKEDLMGEGTSSICRRGYEIATNKKVAIKVYKSESKSGHNSKSKAAVTLQKFKRQILVLKQLQEPFQKPKEPELWCKELEEITPDRVFMILLDHSVDKSGEPGPDVNDGTMYVVTELAQYSLKDWISSCREKKKPVDKETIRNLSKAIVIAMAGLHAKGFVHLDMKPENLMMFDGKLKVIDVDGCVKSGSKIAIQDSSISFSPCYCAPEWARFLISETDGYIMAHPALDCWSVGMTLAELVTFDAILKPTYAQFLRNAQSHREASFLFMEWLGSASKVHLPSEVQHYEKDLHELLHVMLLVGNTTRKSMAQILSHKYLKPGTWVLDANKKALPQVSGKQGVERHRFVDNSNATPLHKGTLWKLNSNGDQNKADHWIKRDMWLAQNHSLCYYSVKENRRLVLIDAAKLASSVITPIDEGSAARSFAFSIKCSEDKDGEAVTHKLAAETEEELVAWKKKLAGAKRMDMIVTLQLGADMAQDLQAFRVTIRNRRKKVEDKQGFEPLFRAKLWKLKGDGDRMKEEDWFERDMWISKNGSLVYYSPKEQSELVYYTAADVARSKVQKLKDGEACRPYAFQVIMPTVDGVEFAPGEFAAETEDQRKQWMEQIANCQ